MKTYDVEIVKRQLLEVQAESPEELMKALKCADYDLEEISAGLEVDEIVEDVYAWDGFKMVVNGEVLEQARTENK